MSGGCASAPHSWRAEPFPTRHDKSVRAQTIRGRMAFDGLHYLAAAPWRAEFEIELMNFPAGKHDDQVDALGLVGQLLDVMVPGQTPKPPSPQRRDSWDIAFERANRSDYEGLARGLTSAARTDRYSHAAARRSAYSGCITLQTRDQVGSGIAATDQAAHRHLAWCDRHHALPVPSRHQPRESCQSAAARPPVVLCQARSGAIAKRRISVFLVRKQVGNGCLTFVYTSVVRTANQCNSGLRLRVGCGRSAPFFSRARSLNLTKYSASVSGRMPELI